MKKHNIWMGRILLALLVLAPCAKVNAGGLYLFDRGARPLARGGAFVAGVDDPSALWYNPAGLGRSKNQVLTDAVMTFMVHESFQRTDASGVPVGPPVNAQNMPLPIPTLAFSSDFGTDDWVFGAGIFAPNTILQGWPQTVNTPTGVQPAPSRYSLLSMRGSLLSALTAGVAYRGIEGLTIGADVQVQMGRFKAQTMLSGCDAFACSFPEDPAYDSLVTLDLFPTVAVSGAAGFQYYIANVMGIGASVTFPYTLEGDAKLNVKLPSSPLFENATISGDKAHIALKFPWIYRVGGEIRPAEWLRMEGAFVYEAWSIQKNIPVTPHHVQMQNIRGIGNYDIGPMAIQRNMSDTWSLRGGFEAFVPNRFMFADIDLVVRGGLAYEKGAFKSNAMTPLTMDANKVILTGGLAINLLENVRFDTVLGLIFFQNMKVRDSQITAPAAIRPESANPTPIGNGNYNLNMAVYLGGGFAFMFD